MFIKREELEGLRHVASTVFPREKQSAQVPSPGTSLAVIVRTAQPTVSVWRCPIDYHHSIGTKLLFPVH